MEAVPGMAELGAAIPAQDIGMKFKLNLVILDSMSDKGIYACCIYFSLELDSHTGHLSKTQITRIARGSGKSMQQVEELLHQFKLFKQMTDMKKLRNFNLPPNIRGLIKKY